MNDQETKPKSKVRKTTPKTEVLENNSSALSKSQSTQTPSEEQRQYWELDLKYKNRSYIISILGFIIIFFGLVFNSWQIYLNTEQLKLNTAQSGRLEKSTRANVQNATLNHVLILDQIFIQKPYLKPYFYDGKVVDEKDEKFQEVIATAEMMLDIFDLVVGQRMSFSEYWDTPEAWDEWMIDVFSTSPILRETYDKHPTWWDKNLMPLRQKAREKME